VASARRTGVTSRLPTTKTCRTAAPTRTARRGQRTRGVLARRPRLRHPRTERAEGLRPREAEAEAGPQHGGEARRHQLDDDINRYPRVPHRVSYHPQGDSDSTRTGSQVRITRVDTRIVITPASAGTPTACRIIQIRHLQPSAPALTSILEDTTRITSPLNEQIHNYGIQVLKDMTVPVNNVTGGGSTIVEWTHRGLQDHMVWPETDRRASRRARSRGSSQPTGCSTPTLAWPRLRRDKQVLVRRQLGLESRGVSQANRPINNSHPELGEPWRRQANQREVKGRKRTASGARTRRVCSQP